MALVTDELSGVLETSPAMSALDVLFVPTGCRGFSRQESGSLSYFVDDARWASFAEISPLPYTQRHSGFAHL
jgi:hypothetical protein